jgi:hypothetical protein
MQGLAWDREHRFNAVRDWLAVLNPQAVTLHCIPRPLQSAAAESPPAKLSAARIMAALGVFLACLSAWALFNRPARMGMTANAMMTASAAKVTPAADAAAEARSTATPSTATPSMATPSNAADPADGQANAQDGLGTDATPPEAAGRGVTYAHHAAVSAAKRASRAVDLASASYRVLPGANFAEVRVRRTSASDRSSLEWWTEESTALSGVDYVPQPPARITFQRGSRTASLFVKLLADSARKDSAKFNVVIGDASKGTLVGLSRAQIVLAPGAAAPGTAPPSGPPIT